MSSPFALLQDGVITIRREPLRYFFWDHVQEIRSSCKTSLHHALDRYGILTGGRLDQQSFRSRLDIIVDGEIPIFFHHEVGERLQDILDGDTLRRIISSYPDSAIEYVSRSIKDVLADTHPQGMVSYIIREQRDASLGFYVGFLAGLRRELFPEIVQAFELFLRDRDWGLIEQARRTCWDKNCRLAETIRQIAADMGRESEEEIKARFTTQILTPLGLDVPERKGD